MNLKIMRGGKSAPHHPQKNIYKKSEGISTKLGVEFTQKCMLPWFKVTFVFRICPKPRFCSFDLDLDQAEQYEV